MNYKFYIEVLNRNEASIKQHCLELLTERFNQLKICLDECAYKNVSDIIIEDLKIEFNEINEALCHIKSNPSPVNSAV